MSKLSRPVLGWVLYDFANSAFATVILAVIFNRYYAEVVAGGPEGIPLNLPWGVCCIPGSVLWSYLVALSTGLVAVTSPLLGAMADQAGLRKKLLVGYCYVGVLATVALSVVGKGDILVGALIFIVANLGFAGGNVFYNSFLLDVSKRSAFGRVSGVAWGGGYLGGGLCLVLCLVMLQKPQLLGFPEGAFDVSHCLVLAGLWWGLFALPTVMWLKDPQKAREKSNLARLTINGWQRLVTTYKELKRFKQLLRFLIAFMIFNDGVETIIVMASIFGAEVVGMSVDQLIAFFIMVQATALVGSLFFGWLSDVIGNKKTLMFNLLVWIGIVVWAYYLGWIFDKKIEFYLLGIVAGLAMGGVQTTARAMQASFTPKERSAEFFGFWAVSGRFASIFGPLIYGSAILFAGGVQSGILVLGVFFVVGGFLLWRVDETEGIRSAS